MRHDAAGPDQCRRQRQSLPDAPGDRARSALYIAGDTVWNPDVANNLQQYQPQVVVLNAGDNQIIGLGSIVMNQEDVLAVHQALPQATWSAWS